MLALTRELFNRAVNPRRCVVHRRRWLLQRCDTARKWTADDDARVTFYSQFVSNGDLIFDVGANVGNRVKAFVRLGARVVAFEPQPECARVLKRVFKGEPNVTICEFPLGVENSVEIMHVGSADTLTTLSGEWIDAVKSSGRFVDYRWDKRVRVVTRSLDEMLRRCGVPRFIKIDVEGFEEKVLSGLSSPVPALSIEFSSEWTEATIACARRIASLGNYRCRISHGETMSFSGDWLTVAGLEQVLERLDHKAYGDIYFRQQ